MFKIKMV